MPLRILFVSANVLGERQLALEDEARAVQVALRHHPRFEVTIASAARFEDIQAHLRQHPAMVHFGGHGSRSDASAEHEGHPDRARGRLLLRDDDGGNIAIAPAALARLFGLFGTVRCVVLNTCFSESQARALSEHVDVVVGARRAIADRHAIAFTQGFYEAISAGDDVARAFALGCTQVDARWPRASEAFVLLARPGVDARGVRIADAPGDTIAAEPDAPARALRAQIEEATERQRTLRRHGVASALVDGELAALKRWLRDAGELRAGDTLSEGRYLLVEPLGRGGFATVWKARDATTDAFVAVKVLHDHLARDPWRRARFERGARVMSKLQHEGVVRALDGPTEEDGHVYFVMEHMPEGDMARLVRAARPSPAQILDTIARIGAALSFAHEHGAVHRDVKPSNILYAAPGDARLADFDLVTPSSDSTGGTGTSALGTLIYSAPEVLHDPTDADARSDVYSLAMTTIFGLSGADLPPSIVRYPAAVIDELPVEEPVQSVLHQAVRFLPQRRFGSMAEFCSALADARSTCIGVKTMPAERGGIAARRRLAIVRAEEDAWEAAQRPPHLLLDERTLALALPSLPVTMPGSTLAYVILSMAHLRPGLGEEEWLRSLPPASLERAFAKVLAHPAPDVRKAAVRLLEHLPYDERVNRLVERLLADTNWHVRGSAIKALARQGVPVPISMAPQLLATETDWVLRSLAGRSLPGLQSCLVVGDGTDFSHDIAALAREAGFVVTSTLASLDFGRKLDSFTRAQMLGHRLLIMVRGEGYSRSAAPYLFEGVDEYVRRGGTLFATTWMAWEAAHSAMSDDVLPFAQREAGSHLEDIRVKLVPEGTQEVGAHEPPVIVRITMERLLAKPGTEVLFSAADGTPLLGRRRVGAGESYYLNACQHVCRGSMPSPLAAESPLRSAVKTALRRIHDAAIDPPTDLAGVASATFAKRTDDNLQAPLGCVRTQVKVAIEHARLQTPAGSTSASDSLQLFAAQAPAADANMRLLEGVWRNDEKSTYCVRFIKNALRCVYSYQGNSEATAEVSNWRMIGTSILATFRWFDSPISGYTYLRLVSPQKLDGGWWYAEDVPEDAVNRLPHIANMQPCTWTRQPGAVSYPWAEEYFKRIGSADIWTDD